MTDAKPPPLPAPSGILLTSGGTQALLAARVQVLDFLRQHQLAECVDVATVTHADAAALQFTLQAAFAERWMPEHDTLGLSERLQGRPAQDDGNLACEILVALLGGPAAFPFASADELISSVRIRRNIALAARKTALAFNTETAERPDDYWHYDEDHGFLLQPGCDLIAGLEKATQPEVSGKLYSFSCYRATEYVILLGIAQELRDTNPALLAELQSYSERHAIRSGQFHDVFMIEYGSMDTPLPPRYYVPGDRLWFRNPHERSADITGFEGSWVLYMGGRLFGNFWAQTHPFTLTTKCVEMYHWRDGAYLDAQGEIRMNDAAAEAPVPISLADPAAVRRILDLMVRLREPKGVYVHGGCIDASREYPRAVRPGTATIVLPPIV